jgi:hypothetical protein
VTYGVKAITIASQGDDVAVALCRVPLPSGHVKFVVKKAGVRFAFLSVF